MATEEDKLPRFKLPDSISNFSGWGPSCNHSNCEDGIPFAPFNKNDKFGRISDWSTKNNKARNRGRFQQQFGNGTGSFQYKAEEDESSFSLVDNKPKPKSRYGRRPLQLRRGGRRMHNNGGYNNRGRGRGNNKWNNRKWNNNNRYRDRANEVKDPSVAINEEWSLKETILFSELEKTSKKVDEGTDLIGCGKLEQYNNAFDSITSLKSKPLVQFENYQFFTTTTSEDPIIERLVKKSTGNVYATDTILAVLMAAAKSVNSWDILVRKEGNNLFFNKRKESKIDFLSVNENWNEVIQTDKDLLNTPMNLSLEATSINHNYSQQVLHKEGTEIITLDEENPFLESVEEGMSAASGAYQYRKFDLGDDITLVTRSFINGYSKRNKKIQKMTFRALNEFDSRLSGNVDWRLKLDTQAGAVLATEMKNNSAKLTRWTAEMILAGTDDFRLGFVSRNHPKDSYKHTILMTKRFEPKAFAQSIGVKSRNLWGQLKHIIDTCKEMEDGNYLILKNPNNPELQIYEVPADAFDHEKGSE